MHVLAIADTHIPDFATSIPKALLREAAKSHVVIHAGDVTSPNVLEELAELAPVIVALDNKDGSDVAAWGAKPEVLINVEAVCAAVIHDAGPAKSRRRRLRRRFPDVRLVIFGHSHIPMTLEAEGQRMLNPGAQLGSGGNSNRLTRRSTFGRAVSGPQSFRLQSPDQTAFSPATRG